MAKPTLKERGGTLDAEVAHVKERPDDEGPRPAAWWKELVGVYRDDPEFEEAARLGREYRESPRAEGRSA